MAEYYGDHFEITEEGCDEFRMAEDNEDSFRMWQGLVGPYYTPYVSPDGTLSFTNNGSLPNPEPVNVRGPQGAGIRIAGIVSSEEDLPTSAAEGDIWLVGESAPYEGYSLNAGQWIDLGPLTVGPAGPPGPQGETGESGPAGPAGQDGEDGVSPEVTVESITGGHTVTITDADHPSGQSFDVMDGAKGDKGDKGDTGDAGPQGPQGETGATGATGPQGPAGPGVPSGGSAGQFYRKTSAADYAAEWYSPAAGDVSYDSSLTYPSGTVGEELNSQRNTLNLKAPIASPVFTGTPSAPTAASGTNTTQIATTEFVQNNIKASSVTVTRIWSEALDILCRQAGNVVVVSGYVQLNASDYTVQMPLFSLSKAPTDNVFFFNNEGEAMRVLANGQVIFHNTTNIPSNTFRFFNFCFTV